MVPISLLHWLNRPLQEARHKCKWSNKESPSKSTHRNIWNSISNWRLSSRCACGWGVSARTCSRGGHRWGSRRRKIRKDGIGRELSWQTCDIDANRRDTRLRTCHKIDDHALCSKCLPDTMDRLSLPVKDCHMEHPVQRQWYLVYLQMMQE